MENTYRFGKTEDKLLRLCRAHVPNVEKIRAVLEGAVNVNAVDRGGHSLLGAVFQFNSARVGTYFPVIVGLFLDAGFDAERLGGRVLPQLVHSTHDRYIFDAVKRLTVAGAKGSDALLEAIGTEESFQRCCEKNHACENIYYAWYELISRAKSGVRFDDIGVWEDCIGLRVDGVVADAKRAPAVDALGCGRYRMEDQVMFLCGERAVTVEGAPNIYLCAVPELINPMDLAPIVPFAVGAVIERIEFEHREHREGTTRYRQPNIRVFFDNGKGIRFSTNFGEVPKEQTAEFFEIME